MKKYIQWQIVKRYKKLVGVLKEENSTRIPIRDFTSFLVQNIQISRDSSLNKKLEEITNLYSDHYQKNGISVQEVVTFWLTQIKYQILYNPSEQLPSRKYQYIYESENENIFEKIENQYKLSIQNDTNDESLKSKIFSLRLCNTIELFLNKYAKNIDTLFIHYWYHFYPYFIKHISKINFKTWLNIESSLIITNN